MSGLFVVLLCWRLILCCGLWSALPVISELALILIVSSRFHMLDCFLEELLLFLFGESAKRQFCVVREFDLVGKEQG